MPISTPAMCRLLGRLTAAMGKPYTEAKVKLQAEEYSHAMGHLPEFAVEWAVNRAVRECAKYPKASELRNMAKQCPQLANGNHDESIRAQTVRWESDPWASIESLDQDRQGCRSTPCPVCGSVIEFSNRGAVIVHDDGRHRELAIGYSNLGKPEWFTVAAPVLPEPKKRIKPVTEREPIRVGEMIRQTADAMWDQAQLERAEMEAVA